MSLLKDWEYREIEKNRPHIDSVSYETALAEIEEQVEEGRATDSNVFIAAAIHEFSNMVNEHIAEWYRMALEREREEK